MTQEVQVTLTLEVDTVITKEDIKAYFCSILSSNISIWDFPKIEFISIEEEKDIYKNE